MADTTLALCNPSVVSVAQFLSDLFESGRVSVFVDLPGEADQDTDEALMAAEKIAAAPAVTVKMARRVIQHLAEPEIRSSMAEELIAQTFINRSDDYAEARAAREEGREPRYTGS